MPELPEVETVVVTLRPRVTGQTIQTVHVHRPDVLTPAGLNLAERLQGQTVGSIDRRGKRIVFTLCNGQRFYIHLGMTGRLTLEPPAAELLKHTHLVFGLSSGEIRFRDSRRFGGLWWLPPETDDATVMGPEPLTLSRAKLADRLSRTRRAVKVALLDQRLIAGLGNIYVDEALHAAGVHPLTPANALTGAQIHTLSKSIKTVLRRAIRSRGSSLRDYVDAEGKKGDFVRYHRVYDRAGEPCVGCSGAIERIVLGGRSTHFCPKCQPES